MPPAAPRGGGFGGPDAVSNQIRSDALQVALGGARRIVEGWDPWKEDLEARTGFGIGADYTSVGLLANDAVPRAVATAPGAGILRLFGAWTLTGRETPREGALVWKVEHRHGYADPAPSPLWAATELGYVGLLAPPFNNSGLRTQNLFWRQRFAEGRYAVSAGFLDFTDFLDTYGMVSPWLHFTNFAFSTGSATIDLPNDAGFGLAFGAMLTDNVYLLGGLQDANGNPERFWESVDSFFDDREYFTTLELGWTSGRELLYLDNYHVTLWHKDARRDAGKPSGWGVNFSFARFVDERWMPFLRGGYADDGDSLLEHSLSAGIGYRLRSDKDLLGIAFNWGRPNPNQGAGDSSQQALELFYRFLAGSRPEPDSRPPMDRQSRGKSPDRMRSG